MAQTVKLKRSAVAAKVPLTSDLALGELAVNTFDGKLFLKKDDGTASVVEIGGGAGAYSVGSTIPSSPSQGQRWLDTNTGVEFTYFSDGSGSQWAETGVNISFSGGIDDGDKGDITVSGAGVIWTINNGAVTLAKQANLATQTVVGRNTAGTGTPEAVTLSQFLDWSSNTQGAILYRGASGWVALAPPVVSSYLSHSGNVPDDIQWGADSDLAFYSAGLSPFDPAGTTSTQFRALLSDPTGTGSAVFADSPTLVTPALGTPSSGTLTNCSGLPAAGVTGLGTLATQSGTFSGTSSGTNSGDQTIANTSDATSHTLTLSSSGGSIQLVEGSNVTLTTTGTSGDGVVTIAASNPGLNYGQTLATQYGAAMP
jgi:hypothetical protein